MVRKELYGRMNAGLTFVFYNKHQVIRDRDEGTASKKVFLDAFIF